MCCCMLNEKAGLIFSKSQTELNLNKALIVNQFESESFCFVAVDDGALFVIVSPSGLLIAVMQSWKHFQQLLYMA